MVKRPSICDLLKKEISTFKIDETGQILDPEKDSYRGLFHYFKELGESLLAYGFLVTLIVITACFFIFDKNVHNSDLNKYIEQILRVSAAFLAIDAALQIAILISSPGIDETIDSITIALASALLIDLSANINLKSNYTFILVMSGSIVFLVASKYGIKLLHKFVGKL